MFLTVTYRLLTQWTPRNWDSSWNLHWGRELLKAGASQRTNLPPRKGISYSTENLSDHLAGTLEPRQWWAVMDTDWDYLEVHISGPCLNLGFTSESRRWTWRGPLGLSQIWPHWITLVFLLLTINLSILIVIIEVRFLNLASWGIDCEYKYKVIDPHWLPRANGTQNC